MSFVLSTFDANGEYKPVDIYVGSGYSVRVVLGWTYCVAGGQTFLSTDLDLGLRDKSNGQTVDSSSSYTNSLEMLEYTNTGAGRTFTVVIKKWGNMQSCLGVQREYAGLSWAVRY